MGFFDEAWETPEYKRLRREVRLAEREYLDLRRQLREAEPALRNIPEDAYLRAKVTYLTKRIKALEDMHPWLTAAYPPEVALFGPPHG